MKFFFETKGVSLLLGVLSFVFLTQTIQKSSKDSDFQDYYQASRLYTQKEDIYSVEDILEKAKTIQNINDIFKAENLGALDKLLNQTGTYIYPPPFAYYLQPLTHLTNEHASLVFALGSWVALGFIFVLYPKRWNLDKQKLYWTIAVGILLSYRFIESHISNNQVGIYLVGLTLLSLFLSKDWASGFFLSLAIVIKLTPAIFLVYFVLTGRWKVVLWTVLFGFFWAGIPYLQDPEYTAQLWKNWTGTVLEGFFQSPIARAWKNNQSLPATLAKLFLLGADPMNQRIFGLPWITLPLGLIKAIQHSSLAILLSLLSWKYATKQIEKDGLISGLFVLSVVFSGISWIHSFIVLIVPILYFVYRWDFILSKAKKIMILVAILTFLSQKSFVGSVIENTLIMFSLFLWVCMVLFFVLLFGMKTPKRRTSTNDPFRIAVDARPLSYGITGNSRYLFEALKHLSKLKPQWEFHLYFHKPNSPVFQELEFLPNVILHKPIALPGPIWLQFYIPVQIAQDGMDLFWGSLQMLPITKSSCPYLVNYHDLNFRSAPNTMTRWNYWQHRILSPLSLRIAQKIFCLSDSTKKDIATHYPSVKEKTTTIYPGVQKKPTLLRLPKIAEKWANPKTPFLFCQSTIEPRKNLNSLVSAYLLVKKQNPDYPFHLVIAGRKGWGEEELTAKLLSGSWEKDGLYFVENPNDEELQVLLENCLVFVFPSLHEGFGLPLLEAMQWNKRILSTDIPVFSEILEEDSDWVLPTKSVEDWADAIQNLQKGCQADKNSFFHRKQAWDAYKWSWERTSQQLAKEMETYDVV